LPRKYSGKRGRGTNIQFENCQPVGACSPDRPSPAGAPITGNRGQGTNIQFHHLPLTRTSPAGIGVGEPISNLRTASPLARAPRIAHHPLAHQSPQPFSSPLQTTAAARCLLSLASSLVQTSRLRSIALIRGAVARPRRSSLAACCAAHANRSPWPLTASWRSPRCPPLGLLLKSQSVSLPIRSVGSLRGECGSRRVLSGQRSC